MYRIYSEWDIGQDNLVFTTEEAVIEWLEDNYVLMSLLEDASFEDMIEKDLIGWQEVTIID